MGLPRYEIGKTVYRAFADDKRAVVREAVVEGYSGSWIILRGTSGTFRENGHANWSETIAEAIHRRIDVSLDMALGEAFNRRFTFRERFTAEIHHLTEAAFEYGILVGELTKPMENEAKKKGE